MTTPAGPTSVAIERREVAREATAGRPADLNTVNDMILPLLKIKLYFHQCDGRRTSRFDIQLDSRPLLARGGDNGQLSLHQVS
jgi:hypothetical protein